MTCTHAIERSRWVEHDADDRQEFGAWGEWEVTTEHTTKDIGIGAYQCTQCGEVMYYTGSWRKFYETGEPCPSSTLVRPDDATRVRKAAKK